MSDTPLFKGRISTRNMDKWPLGYGVTAVGCVTDFGGKPQRALLLRAVPDALTGRVGDVSPEEWASIPEDAPCLLLSFKDEEAIRKHIEMCEELIVQFNEAHPE